jgi:hypothetical protein
LITSSRLFSVVDFSIKSQVVSVAIPVMLLIFPLNTGRRLYP